MNNKPPKVAVLLAAYNGDLWIERQINSILAQTGVILDVYVSVDLSSDETYAVLLKLNKNDSRIHILEYGQRFGSAARNFYRLLHDVDLTRFDYVAFSDQDDIWMEVKVYFAISQIINENVDAYSSDVIAFWDDGAHKLVKKSWRQKKFDYLFEAAGPGCTYVFRVEGIISFKRFMLSHWVSVNQIALHDWLLYAYFRSRGMRWLIDSIPLMYYRQHSSNEMGVNSGLKAYIRRVSDVRAKWYRGEVEKIAGLLSEDVPTVAFMLRNIYHLRRRMRDVVIIFAFVIFGLY